MKHDTLEKSSAVCFYFGTMPNITPLLLRSEHERHSPNCPFVKGEHTQNVPLSVTLATSPAQFPNTPDGSDKIACYGFGSCPQFLAAATKRGKICIWDVSKMMKVRAANCEYLGQCHPSCDSSSKFSYWPQMKKCLTVCGTGSLEV